MNLPQNSSDAVPAPTVAIVDYGVGNLFSIRQACIRSGLQPLVTSDPAAVTAAQGVVLPGVGAFGTAMEALRRSGLDAAVTDAVGRGVPTMGICLGFQLLMLESLEFGRHRGLGLIDGMVLPLRELVAVPSASEGAASRRTKVPRVGWGVVHPPSTGGATASASRWEGTYMNGLVPGGAMYFVHSYGVRLANPAALLAVTPWAGGEYCSAVQIGRLFGCQFHPERSALQGLAIYRNFGDEVRSFAVTGDRQHIASPLQARAGVGGAS